MKRTLIPLLLFVAGPAAADEVPVKLSVFPPAVRLEGQRDRQTLSVQALFADGHTEDVTAQAKLTLTDQARAKLDAATLTPLADGKAELKAEHAGLSATAPVEVRDAAVSPPVNFKLDVMPAFTRAGCNSGKCHGAAKGKNGFRLSLFGYDPDGDHYRLLREMPGRRVSLAEPAESLLLKKGMGRVAHVGGTKIRPDSDAHKTLLSWLEAGAPADAADVAHPVSLEVLPGQAVLAAKGSTQKLTVRAKYSDGSDRDVTPLAVFLSNNDGAATIDGDGLVNAEGPGEAFIMARFATLVEGTQVIVRPGNGPFAFKDVPEKNDIDKLVNAKLTKLHVQPSDLCGDEVFLRRAHVDLVGLLPTRAETEKFLADTSADKREKLVDALLARPEFDDLWVMKWSELLQIRSVNGVSPKALDLYNRWLGDRIRSGASLDKVVGEVLSASGGTFQTPAANYFQTETTPQILAENVAQVFLGMRVQCAQCHNHPFDRWTMDDYYGFTAFFNRVGYKQAQDPRELTVFLKDVGETKHPVDGRPVMPKFLGADRADCDGKDPRQVLAGWLASPENPQFGRNLANIVWAHFMGVGVVEPVDDVRVSNPPSNPELLDYLGKKLTEYRYDVRKLARDICLSNAYQRTTKANASNALDGRNFAKGPVRRIRAEVLLDVIDQVTESKTKFPGLPPEGRAVHVVGGRVPNYFLNTFGRASRETPCACEVKAEPTLSQALHLLNGDTTNEKVTAGKVVARLLEAKKTPEEVVEELYVRCYCRKPTAEEMNGLREVLKGGKDVRKDLEDIFWALLNSKEFLFNH